MSGLALTSLLFLLLFALGVQPGLGVPIRRCLQPFRVSERHVVLLRLVTHFVL